MQGSYPPGKLSRRPLREFYVSLPGPEMKAGSLSVAQNSGYLRGSNEITARIGVCSADQPLQTRNHESHSHPATSDTKVNCLLLPDKAECPIVPTLHLVSKK